MKLYHVSTKKKLLKYFKQGYINPPVRAWINIQEAERFSTQTGRRFIIRLKSNDTFKTLEGHKGMAVVSDSYYKLEGF